MLPYIEAVIKEGLRIHPTVGLCLERVGTSISFMLSPSCFIWKHRSLHIAINKAGHQLQDMPFPLPLSPPLEWTKTSNTSIIVPEPGFTLPDGRFIPAGNIVGLNPSVMTRDRNVYGPDADTFRPERWLPRYSEKPQQYAERVRKMDELNTFVWGGGNRTCLGRFLATTSLYKVTAMLVGRYDFELEDPTKEWVLRRHWMVYNDKIRVRISRREKPVDNKDERAEEKEVGITNMIPPLDGVYDKIKVSLGVGAGVGGGKEEKVLGTEHALAPLISV